MKKKCDHPNCRCEIEIEKAVTRGGESYCSVKCANGRGCDHPGCECGQIAHTKSSGGAPGEDSQARKPANQASPTKPAPANNPGHQTVYNPAAGNPSIRSNP